MAEEGRVYVAREIELPLEFEEPAKFIVGPECAIGERIPTARTRGYNLRITCDQVVVCNPPGIDTDDPNYDTVVRRSTPSRPFLVPHIDKTGVAIGIVVSTEPVKIYSHDDERWADYRRCIDVMHFSDEESGVEDE